eukprot:6822157-Pyramimonas_sp.AAC.3
MHARISSCQRPPLDFLVKVWRLSALLEKSPPEAKWKCWFTAFRSRCFVASLFSNRRSCASERGSSPSGSQARGDALGFEKSVQGESPSGFRVEARWGGGIPGSASLGPHRFGDKVSEILVHPLARRRTVEPHQLARQAAAPPVVPPNMPPAPRPP